jgi:DNA-binding MarR family transcriptional regulator
VISEEAAAADWELGKLVHDLDLQNNARMRARVARLDLTTAQASALCELAEPMTIGELAGRMSCEPSNATAVIDKLEDLRLIERRPHPTDRRAKQLHVTPDGADRRTRLLALLREELMVTGLTDRERATLKELLQRALTPSDHRKR